jgi:hypothetical protein
MFTHISGAEEPTEKKNDVLSEYFFLNTFFFCKRNYCYFSQAADFVFIFFVQILCLKKLMKLFRKNNSMNSFEKETRN